MNNKQKFNKIKEIKIGDIDYPEKLLHIYAPPHKLYVLGDENILNEKAIAIIGCRNCSNDGERISYYFARELAKKKVHIISGLARGIDSVAHKAVIDENIKVKENIGKTIAVLGCGLDTVYPPENKNLYKEIVQTGGAIITEYPLGSKPIKNHFPARNRIISGLSEGVLVIEARKKSGTLITVEHALDQGKDVYAVPRKYIE